MNDYLPTIGIECHVQLKTRSKLFAAVANDARSAPPNSLVSHICFGMPGALPVLNEQAITLAIRAAFALGTTPQTFSKFDRKHYFYPDLPKGYQISQFNHPIIAGGEVNITIDGQPKTIGITRAHLEEDAGKSTHPAGKDYSLVDLNRAGTPLLEIVSEPDIHSAAEAKAYAHELYLLMKYANVTDGDLYHGHMRFDVNVSVSKDSQNLGVRSETKNLNSFRSVEKAVEYEIKRQVELLEKGGEVIQETRGWDDAKQKTFSQRSKEEAHDYRYFPDPDIPPVVLDEKMIMAARETIPFMPHEWRKRLSTLGLNEEQIEILLEAEIEDSTTYLPILNDSLHTPQLAKFMANYFVNVQIPLLREIGHEQLATLDSLKILESLYRLLEADKLSSTNAKAIYVELIQSGTTPENIEKYAEEKGYLQVSNEGEVTKIVEQVLADNPQAAEDVKNGETKAIGFLVGQVMKASKGQANPSLAQKLIKTKLGL